MSQSGSRLTLFEKFLSYAFICAILLAVMDSGVAYHYVKERRIKEATFNEEELDSLLEQHDWFGHPQVEWYAARSEKSDDHVNVVMNGELPLQWRYMNPIKNARSVDDYQQQQTAAIVRWMSTVTGSEVEVSYSDNGFSVFHEAKGNSQSYKLEVRKLWGWGARVMYQLELTADADK